MTTLSEFTANGYFKVAETSGCYCTAIFFNPTTKDYKSICTRDYDYSDCSRDNDELYYAPINEDIRKEYLHFCGCILVGDTVEVFKGRKVPVGTIGTVVKKFDYKDNYGRVQATYVVFADGQKTNIANCRLVNA